MLIRQLADSMTLFDMVLAKQPQICYYKSYHLGISYSFSRINKCYEISSLTEVYKFIGNEFLFVSAEGGEWS